MHLPTLQSDLACPEFYLYPEAEQTPVYCLQRTHTFHLRLHAAINTSQFMSKPSKTYTAGEEDCSNARQKKRSLKLARFNYILSLQSGQMSLEVRTRTLLQTLKLLILGRYFCHLTQLCLQPATSIAQTRTDVYKNNTYVKVQFSYSCMYTQH